MQAYKLTSQAQAEGFSGGTVMCSPRGDTFDVKQALDEHDGVIVTDDPTLSSLLANYPALEATDAPDGASLVEVPGQESATATQAPPWIPQQGPLDPQVGSVGEVPAVHVEDDNVTGEPAVSDSTDVSQDPSTTPATNTTAVETAATTTTSSRWGSTPTQAEDSQSTDE